MSLKLKFDGITDWKIGNDYFRRGTFSHYNPYGFDCWVRAQTQDWAFTKHNASGGGLNLNMPAPVWVDAWVWDGLQFSRGGYLEEVTHQYVFTNAGYGGGDWVVNVNTLGIRADTYHGGVKIEGIASPPNSWTDITASYAGSLDTGSVYISYSESFVWNNNRISIVNWRAVNAGWQAGTIRMSAVVCGAIANNIQFYIDTQT